MCGNGIGITQENIVNRANLLSVCLAAVVLALSQLTFSGSSKALPTPVEAMPVTTSNPAAGAEPMQPKLDNCCLRRINKVMKGERRGEFSEPYNCDTGRTAKGVTKVALTLTTPTPHCDQDVAVPNHSRLEAACTTIRRADQFGHSICDFTIKHPDSGATHFSGTLILIDRASQPKPTGCRKCDAEGFLEGWIDGVGQGMFAAFKLQAVVTARATIPTDNRPMAFTGDLNGTLLKCP